MRVIARMKLTLKPWVLKLVEDVEVGIEGVPRLATDVGMKTI